MITTTGPNKVYQAGDVPDFVGDACTYGSHTHDVDVPEGGGGVNLSNVTPNDCTSGAVNLNIVSHDVHVLKQTFGPMSGDTEAPYSVGMLGGYIELNNVEQISGEYIPLAILFDSFPTGCNKIMVTRGYIDLGGYGYPVICETDPSYWSTEGNATLTKLNVAIDLGGSSLTIPASSDITLYL